MFKNILFKFLSLEFDAYKLEQFFNETKYEKFFTLKDLL